MKTFGDKFTVMKMWERGLLFLFLTYSTYVHCTLIPNRSLVISTHKGKLLVFSGLEDWVQNDIINTTLFYAIGSGPLNNTRGLSFIHRESREIFIFSDADFTTISAINVTSPTQQAIVFHIGTSSGVGQLAVDWVSGNCYWVDTVYGWIVMQAIPKDLSRFDSRNPNFKMVVDTYLDIPTGIAVYPELGYLYWTDTGQIPKIERSSLTGKDRKLLVWQGVIWPTSLCIDYSKNRLYWTDPGRGTVEYSDLHGNGRDILVYNPGSSFYGIDIFQDVVVVSEWSSGSVNGSLKLFNIPSGKQTGRAIKLSGNPAFSLAVYDSRRQPLDSSQRCDTMECQHICIEKPNSTGADCACEDGFMLNPNGRTCEAEAQVLQRKIVYTDTNKICFVSINAITSHQYLTPEVGCTIVNSTNNITRFTIDTHNRTFYFTDGHKIYHQIQFSINGSQEVYSTNRAIIDLAYDWIKRVLYWFEWDVDGGVCYKKTNPSSPIEEFINTTTKPVTMTFDPYSQILFWISSNIMESKVRLYNTAADGRTANIASSIMRNPTDLEYDWSTDRLVWTDDGFMGRINSDGRNEKRIDLNSSRTHHSLTVFKNYTIIGYSVTRRPDDAAFTVVLDGETTRQIDFKLPNMKRVDDVKVYDQQLTIEPCERNNGGCEQICIPESSTTCGCYAGYKLSVDGKTCAADLRQEDFILAIDSVDHKVYQISTDGKNINALKMGKGTLPSSIDFDPINQRIVLIDQSEKRIQYFQLSGKGVRAEKKDDITQYSHVAVDVSTGNFYVTFNKTIAVIDPDFDVRTLITTSLTPGKLIVFPKFGEMVWIEGSKIRKAKMDGTEPNDFTPERITSPRDIAFDYEDEALYWCDGNQIGRTELLTASTEVIVSGTAEQPKNIYVAGQYLYYTSSINIRAIYRRKKTKGEDFGTVFESPLIGLASLFVYQNPISALNEECSVSNGRCCKFCLPLRSKKRCACTDGSSLNNDGRTCSPEMECPLSIPNAELEGTCLPCYNRHCSFTCKNGFERTVRGSILKCGSLGNWNYSTEVCKPVIPNRSLVISTHKGKLLVFSGLEDWVQNDIINTTLFYAIGSGPLNNTRGLSFIHRESREIFIFSDADFTTISAINVTSPTQQAIVFHIGTSSGVGQLAVDWVSGNCYWVDTVYGWIVMQAIPKDLSRFDSRNPNFKMVVDTYLDTPTGIAVYPELGYLYWTDTGQIPKIERSSLTGKDRKLLVWQGVIWPTSLCIDYSKNRLYWTDPGRGTVEYSDLHGNGRDILVYNPGSSFYGIDIFQDVVVVSEWSSGSVNGSLMLFNIPSGKQTGRAIKLSGNPAFSLAVYDSRRQPLDSSQRCDTMECQHICIEKPNSTGADCACEDGFMLNPNGRTCEAEAQVLQRKIVYTDTNKICFVSINAITSHQYLTPEVGCTIVNSTNNITRFTIDTHNRTFYFTDGHKIYHQIQFSIDGSQEVYSTNRAIIDLAYDWIKRVLYWFEWDVDGGFCYKKTNPSSPREEFINTTTKPVTMTFDPYSQLLFWISSNIMESKVRLYNTAADGRTTNIASSIMRNPTDLEYDWSTDRLVWTDDGFMGRINSDGRNEKRIDLNSSRTHHSLTVFKNYTIIGYSVTRRPDDAAFTVVLDGETTRQIDFKLPNMKRVDDVKVYDQQLTIEPCERNNGGCEQICIPESSTTCGCYAGYKLSVDGKTCAADLRQEDFILAIDSVDHKVYQISTDGKNINALKMGKGTLPSSIDFDPINQRIVLIDQSEKRIQYFQLSGKGVRAEKKDDITQYSHVAVDVSTGNFYVTFNKTIAVIDPDFDVRTLITTSLTPGKLIVFPKFGEMVWIEGSKIRKAKMDGTEPNDFTPERITSPRDIAFDYEDEALYWCDGNQIGRTELLTASTEVIVSGTAEQPKNIYVAGQYLYYTSSINIRAIYRRKKTKGEDFGTVFESPLIGLASLFVYQNPISALNEECSVSNGRCCKFCLPLRSKKRCACTDGSSLNNDGRTCSPEMECPLSIPNAELEGTCLPCYNRHCSFTCKNGFERTVRGSILKCGSLGNWNYSTEVCKPDTPYGIIIGAAVGGGGFLLVVTIIIVYFKRRRSKKVPREIDRLQPPVPVPRVDTFKQQELEEEYDYINDSTLYHETANGQTPPYIELSESQQDYQKLSEKDPYKRKIVGSNRPSKTVHDDYLTASIAGSLKEGLNDLRVSVPEEDNHGYLRSSSDGLRRGSESSDVSTRYQRWDMFEQQARGYQAPPASHQGRYPDERSFHYNWSQRY